MSGKRRVTWGQLSTEFVAGCLFFLAMLVLGSFTILLSREKLFGHQARLEVTFPHVAALSEGDNVLVRGVMTGRVDRVELGDQEVRVQLALRQPLVLYNDYRIEVKPSSVLGGRHLAVEVGTPEAGVLPPGTALHGQPPVDLMAEIGKLAEELRTQITTIAQTIDREKVIPKLGALLDDARVVVQEVKEGKGTIGKLIQDPGLYDQAVATAGSLRDAGTSLRSASDEVKAVVAEARAGKGTIGKLLTDEALFNDVKAIVGDVQAGKGTLGKLVTDEAVYEQFRKLSADLADVSGKLAAGESTLGRLMTDKGEVFGSVRQTMENLQAITDQVRNGSGTLGKLVNDASLYDDARKTVNEVRSAVEDFREQTPISTFGSLVFGAL